jgi:hypothetical protein
MNAPALVDTCGQVRGPLEADRRAQGGPRERAHYRHSSSRPRSFARCSISGDGPLEHVLIQECVLTYLNLEITRCRYEAHVNSPGTVAFAEAEFWEKRLSTAQRRHLRAAETLARVRKINLTIQVNIATRGGRQRNRVG